MANICLESGPEYGTTCPIDDVTQDEKMGNKLANLFFYICALAVFVYGIVKLVHLKFVIGIGCLILAWFLGYIADCCDKKR